MIRLTPSHGHQDFARRKWKKLEFASWRIHWVSVAAFPRISPRVIRALAWTAAILASPIDAEQTSEIIEDTQAGVPDATWPKVYFPHFDAVVASVGLAPLRTTELPGGTREIRVWIGGGIGYPQSLYRVVEDETGVFGELVLYWPSQPRDDDAPGESFHDLILFYYSGSCEKFFNTGTMEACRTLFAEQPNWREKLRAAEKSGLWDLPDSTELPDDGILTLDGWAITVELHDGEVYRTYQYSNPQSHPAWPEAAQAIELADIFRSIRDLVRPADVEGVYRGITTGEPGSAFSLCDREMIWATGFSLAELAEMAGLNVPDAGSFGYIVSVAGKPTPEWLARDWESDFSQVLQAHELVSIAPARVSTCD